MGKSNSLITIVLVALISLAAGWYIGQQDLAPTQIEEESTEEQQEEDSSIVVELPEKEIKPELPELEGVTFNIPNSGDVQATITKEAIEGTEDFSYFATFTDDEDNGDIAIVSNQLMSVNDETFVVPFVVKQTAQLTTKTLCFWETVLVLKP